MKKIPIENSGQPRILEQQTKTENLISERTEITPFLGMDWMKKFQLAIGRIQLAEIS